MFTPNRAYRPDEVAEVLQVSVQVVYQLIRDVDRPLPAFRTTPNGRGLRIWGRDANAYYEKLRVRPEEE